METLFYRQTDSSLEKMGEFWLFQTVYNIMQEDLSQHRVVFLKALQGKPGLPCVGNKLLYQVKTNPCRGRASLRWAGKTSSGKASLEEAYSKCLFFHRISWLCEEVKLTKNGLYPAVATGGTAPRGPAAGGSTGRPEEKMPRAFRFKPGIRLACCCAKKRGRF